MGSPRLGARRRPRTRGVRLPDQKHRLELARSAQRTENAKISYKNSKISQMTINVSRMESFHAIQNPPEIVPLIESETSQKLEKEYRNSYPQEKFGEVSIALADIKGFVEPFEQALELGFKENSQTAGDEFLTAGAAKGLENVYVIKSAEGSPLALKEPKAWEHHQSKSLDTYAAQLQKLKDKLTSEYSDVNPLFREAYGAVIDNQLDFCANAQVLGSPEYTVGQRNEEQWGQLIDIDATTKSGEVTLVHEQLAIETLEQGISINQEKTQLFATVEQAFDFWKFTEAERAEITGTEPITDKLTPTQGRQLFDVLRKRLGLNDWEIVVNTGSKAIAVNSGARKIDYPETRSLTPDEMVILLPHELGTHAVSGENGDKQACPLLRTGMPDYLATQEGLATISEMIVGEPFGHPRQRLFAARYLAAAMSLKTIETADGRKPKHTLQDIYNTLRTYKIGEKDAAQTIWRLARGTSLTRQVVDVPVGNDQTIPVAETFAKDAVYFEGFVKLRDFFMQTIPLLEKEVDEHGNVSIHGQKPEDFSTKLLARVGRAIAMQNTETNSQSTSPSFEAMRTVYDSYVSLGRESLMDIMQYFLVGKLRFEDMTTGSPWNDVLKRNGLIQFKKLFEPSAN